MDGWRAGGGCGVCGQSDRAAAAHSPHTPHTPFPPSFLHPPTMAADLAEVGTADLLAEVQRRLDCADKPEKRIILVGESGERWWGWGGVCSAWRGGRRGPRAAIGRRRGAARPPAAPPPPLPPHATPPIYL